MWGHDPPWGMVGLCVCVPASPFLLTKKKAMKKTLTMILLLSANLQLFAPNGPYQAFTIVAPEKITPNLDPLIDAIFWVEAQYDTLAYNPVEQATGGLQIRPIRLEDYNKRTGKDYQMKDMFNFEISKEVFLYYARQIGFDDWETIARKWNGSGPKTIEYWEKVQTRLKVNV